MKIKNIAIYTIAISLLIISSLVVIYIVASVLDTDTNTIEEIEEPTTINIPKKNKENVKLKVENVKIIDNEIGKEISGEIKNITGKDIGYLEVRIDFFDKENNLVDQAFVNALDVGKNATWKFSDLILEDYDTMKFIIEADFEL